LNGTKHGDIASVARRKYFRDGFASLERGQLLRTQTNATREEIVERRPTCLRVGMAGDEHRQEKGSTEVS
jgi:hypothetical protein